MPPFCTLLRLNWICSPVHYLWTTTTDSSSIEPINHDYLVLQNNTLINCMHCFIILRYLIHSLIAFHFLVSFACSACMNISSDVTFLLGSSIGGNSWLTIKQFVIGVIDSMDLANDMTRVAVIRYSAKVYLYIIDRISNHY